MSTEIRTANAKHIFIDIVSYTHKRSVEAQSDLIKTLNEIVSKVIKSKKIPSENIIFIPTGDGMCISLIDLFKPFDIHIEIARIILQSLNVHNEKETDWMRQFKIRIGINENLDNIITDINGNINVSGAGINHAARIEGLADGNQIIVGNSVYETMVQREKYMDSFRSYNTEVKHGLSLNIHQLIDRTDDNLNSDVPSRFASTIKERKLNELQAYYIGFCLQHEKFVTEKMEYLSSWSYPLTILFIYMAEDSISLNRKTKSDPNPRCKVKGQMAEYFDKLRDMEFWVTCDLASSLRKDNLYDISSCFEEPYLFVNKKGKDKLKAEHPRIFEELELN